MGLLDFLGSDDAKLGLGLLAAGGQSATPLDTWQRVQGAVQGLDADKQRKLQLELMQSQLAENAGQTALRQQQLALAKRKFDMQAGLLGYGGSPETGMPAAAGPPVAGGGMAAAPAGMGAGAGAPQAGPSVPTPRGPMTLPQIAEAYKIPFESLAMDLVNNDGKGIAEMVFKRGTPDMQVSNGYAYDKNRTGPGYLPQLNMSQDGKASMVQIGPDGMPVVSAPRGAVSTFGAYEGVKNRSNADFTPERVIDPATGQTVVRPRSQVLQPAAGGAPAGYATESQMRTTVAGDMGADPKALAREIAQTRNDLMKPLDEGSKKLLRDNLADLLRQQQNLGPAPMAGNVVELSPAQQTANEAARVKAVDTAKADVGRQTALTGEVKKSGQMSDAAATASRLLDMNPTASGAGALADTALNFLGTSTKGATVAQQLEAVSGFLVANVPRMEGPQSDADVRNYRAMAGNVGDRTLPVAARKAALQTVVELQQKYAETNAAASGSPPAAKTFGSFKEAGYANESAAIKDAQNAIMRGAPREAVQKRLKDMGLSLPAGAQGSW